MSYNKCPDAVQLCKENLNKINWNWMSKNKCYSAVQLCRENIDNVDWYNMSMNECPEAVQLCNDNKLLCDEIMASQCRYFLQIVNYWVGKILAVRINGPSTICMGRMSGQASHKAF